MVNKSVDKLAFTAAFSYFEERRGIISFSCEWRGFTQQWKSERQSRAEAAAVRFRTDARRPVVIEFAGVPKAGKTSTIAQVHNFLKRCGFRVQVVVERASVCPVRDKKHFTFNVWTAATTLSQIL